jgi:hypothetical protein
MYHIWVICLTGTFYVNSLKVDSLSPKIPFYTLPISMYVDPNNFIDKKFTNEDDKWRNKPKMLRYLRM